MAENISIVPLYEKPEYAPILAHWSYSEWYLKRDIPFDVNLKAYQRRSQSRKIPLSLVAIVGTVPVGMVSLKENDLWSRKDLNPWLASLFVLKEYRHIGVGTMLVRQLVREAEALGYAGLHLFLGHNEESDLGRYYRNLGWSFLESAKDNDGCDTDIYYYRISREGLR